MNLRFLSLASGSSGNCYYIGNDRHGMLIDAGIGIRTIKKLLKEQQIPFESILGICVTHDHADHIKSVGILGEKYGIPVYATPTILKGMNRSYCMTEKIVQSGRPIEKEVPFTLGDFTITAFEVPHDGSDNVGYLITYKEHKFALATDLGHITPTVASYMAQANYMILESNYDAEMLAHGAYPRHLKERITNPNGHLSNRAAADFLLSIFNPELRYVFLCHLSKENNHPELAYKTFEMVLMNFGIRAGKDLHLEVLKRNTPIYHELK